MSWDVLIINSKDKVDFEKGDWENFKSKSEVIQNLKTSFPEIDFTDPTWGIIDTSKVNIEFNLGDEEDLGNNFMIHVRAGLDPTGEIARMCFENNWQAFDLSEGDYIDLNNPTQDSFNNWQDFKDHVINTIPKKPWWKFW